MTKSTAGRADYPPIVSQIVDRCHCGQSNLAVIKYFVSRLRLGYTTWRKMPRAERRQWLQWVVPCHADNRELYNFVMKGRAR